MVHYFHQVDDPYSHLAVQKLERLQAAYDLPFVPHLVAMPAAEFLGDSERYEAWALRDAASIADGYGASLKVTHRPRAKQIAQANDLLAAHLNRDDFARQAVAVGEALWSGELPPATGTDRAGAAAVRDGSALRARLGHYASATFYYEGEWFGGIDRLRLLEQRLLDEGFGRAGQPLCVPEPTPVDTSGLRAGRVALEYFPSLRSPYTAIGHQRMLDLVARSGVTVQLRPVMPMLMRGVPAPFAKQRYIVMDAAREGRARNVPFGPIVDPFGEPVKRAFALFPAAVALGKGMDFVTAYLSAAWMEGIDVTTETGLQQVADHAGIDWTALQQPVEVRWETLLDENLQAMLSAGLWGVPSFRVSGGRDEAPFVCWGQDRLWLVENEIARRA